MASVYVDSQGEVKPSVVRQQEEMTAVETAQATVDRDDEYVCDYPIEQQMTRIAMSVYHYKPKNLEMKVDNFPKWLRWTQLNMKKCGWQIKFYECVAPCNKKNHDGLLVAINLKGNIGGVKPKTCAVAFTGKDDDDELKNGIRTLYGIKPDLKKWKAQGKTLNLETESEVMYRWKASFSQKQLVTTKFHFEDYQNFKSATKFNAFETMVSNGECEHLISTGHSNGGAIAQIFHVDKADMYTSGDYEGQLKDTCYDGKVKCHSILYSSIPGFTKDAPRFKDCTGNFHIAASADAAPKGISSPPGPDIDEYEDVYGKDSAKEVNIPLGIQRVYLESEGRVRTFSKVKAEDQSCHSGTVKTDRQAKFYRRIEGNDIVNKFTPNKGDRVKDFLMYNPWHYPPYVIISTDMWSQKRSDNYFTHPGAAVYDALFGFEWGDMTKEYEKKDDGAAVHEPAYMAKNAAALDSCDLKGCHILRDGIKEMRAIDGLLVKPGEEEREEHDDLSVATKAKVSLAAVKMWKGLQDLNDMPEEAVIKVLDGLQHASEVSDAIDFAKISLSEEEQEPEKEEEPEQLSPEDKETPGIGFMLVKDNERVPDPPSHHEWGITSADVNNTK